MNLALRIIFVRTSKTTLTRRKIVRQLADSFTFPLKEDVLRIFMAIKSHSPSAGFESANSGTNGKHSNHYTTEDDYCQA
jgi:hypothetical protein